MPAIVKLDGQIFGRLTVLWRDTTSKKRGVQYVCECTCGTRKSISGEHLRRGATKSCGCLNSETTAARNKLAKRSHGMAESPEYQAWHAMKQRCLCQNDPAYPRYGARGINICPTWQESFEKFYEDIGQRPSSKHSLDRIDNSRGYWPENVRWATAKEQCRNRSNNFLLSFMGKTLCAAEWAEELGISQRVIYNRSRRGWSTEKTLTTPIGGQSVKH